MYFRQIGALAAMGLIAGCTGGQDLGQRYADYDAAYQDQFQPVIHSVPRGGYELHAREFKPDLVEPDGAPFILMHGFPDSLHLYDRLAPLLAKRSRVIVFDFLGWGKSDKPEQHAYDVASLRADLEAIITHFRLEQVRLVVHDASGPPGIDYALDNPKQTAELILLNTLYAPSENRVVPPAIKRFSTPGLGRDLLAFGARINDSAWQTGYRRKFPSSLRMNASATSTCRFLFTSRFRFVPRFSI